MTSPIPFMGAFGGGQSPSFNAPLITTLVPNSSGGASTPTYTRATTAYVQNNDGYLVQALSGEARFTGARRIYNLIPAAGSGSASLAVAAAKTMTLAAGTYVFSMGAGTGTATFSGTGGATGTLAASASGRVSVSKTITAGTLVVTASVATLVDLQVEWVDPQTTKTAGEYVSVGALDYRNDKDPLYVNLTGAAGTYVSTPDSPANSITGDIEVVIDVALVSYTTGSQCLFSKYGAAGNRGFLAQVIVSGHVNFVCTVDGTTAISAQSSVTLASVGIVAGQRINLKINRASATGTWNIYYSVNYGATYTQLGEGVAATGGALFDSTANVELGGYNGGTNPANGRIYSAQIYNGINGTLAVDYNAHRDAVTPTGTITSSTTGEVWTNNGAATVRSAAYHSTGVDGTKCFNTDIAGAAIADATLDGYLAEGQRQNRCLYSQDFTNAAWVSGGGGIAVTSNTAVAPDGTTTADTLTASGANGTLIQDLGVVASAAKAGGLYLKRKTGTGNIDLTLDGGSTWTTVAVTSSWLLLEKTQTLADEDFGIRIVTSGDEVYAWQAQVETVVSSTAKLSSVIPTTTAAVTRNFDALTFSSTGNLNEYGITSYFEFKRPVGWGGQSIPAASVLSFGDYTQNASMYMGGYSGVQHSVLGSFGTVWSLSGAFGTAHNPLGSRNKTAISFDTAGEDVTASTNGSAVSTVTASPVKSSNWNAQIIAIGNIGTTTYSVDQSVNIRNVKIWQTAKTDAQLQALTA